jgi:hypothetical protein
MKLIAERYGKAKQQEAFQFILEMWPIWRLNVARYKKRKSAKRAATGSATERATELAIDRAATITEMAPWDVTWAAANPTKLFTPSSHMVCRALLQMMTKKKNEPASSEKPRMRVGDHNMGQAPQRLDDDMNAMKGTTEEYARKCDLKPAWWTDEGGGGGSASSETSSIFSTQTTPTCSSTIGLHSAS